MTYETLAYIAETWGLLWLACMFVAVFIYALWPGNREKFHHAARMPLESREDGPTGYGPPDDRSST